MPKAKAKKKPLRRGVKAKADAMKAARNHQRHSTSRKAAPRKAAAAKLQYIPWHTVQMEQLNPLLKRQFVVGQEIMMARILLKKGCVVPMHSHHNEQMSYILEGALKFAIDGREIIVEEGEVLSIPAHMPHQAEALRDTTAIDIFTPPRADWINKNDDYLRRQER